MQRAHDRASASWGLGKGTSLLPKSIEAICRSSDAKMKTGKWSKMEIEGGKDANVDLGLPDFFSRFIGYCMV